MGMKVSCLPIDCGVLGPLELVGVKIIELSTVLTAALWLGTDYYDTIRKCAGAVYEQLKLLKTIKHPLKGKEIKIVRQSCGDGKERRPSTGNSSAKSSYSKWIDCKL